MTRRTLYLPVVIAAALAMACLVALLAVSQKAEATFPGKNGRIAFEGDRDTGTGGSSAEIITVSPRRHRDEAAHQRLGLRQPHLLAQRREDSLRRQLRSRHPRHLRDEPLRQR